MRLRKRYGLYSLMAFMLTCCASVSAVEPAPITTTTVEAPQIGDALTSVTVTQIVGPDLVYCKDGTQHTPEVTQVVLWSDGTTTKDVIQPFECHPWPTHCADGTILIPPAALAGYKVQCLAYGKPLFSWYVHLLGLPEIFITTIIPRESNWDASVVNSAHCVGLTQHCGKAAYYQAHGWQWPQDAQDPWKHLVVTADLYATLKLQPWQCGKCSLR